MGSFATEAVRSTATTQSDINNYKQARENSRTASNAFNTNMSYSVVGINANKIPATRAAIQSYVNDVKAVLKDMDTQVETAGAFRGDAVKKAVQEYLVTVKTYCENLVTYLNVFSDKLKDVQDSWEKYLEQAGTSINTQKSGFGTYQAYQSKYSNTSSN